MGNNNSAPSQVISLPKGGGAIHGIGEKFSPDLHTGTGNFTVPIALPPGRNGFQPQINLIYSTGNGNGPFGLGWSLSIPGVSRKTSKGVPRYDDAKDVFILSGAEDLVPVPGAPSGATRYRPRTEGLFARIEHHHSANDDYWEVRSKDGLVSWYGNRDAARSDPTVVANTTDRTKIFAWKLTQTEDSFGNQIRYEYARDTGQDGPHHWDQLYLQRIRYADYTENNKTEFLVTVTFTYENRPDPFSEYRPGFEIRTRQRCTQIEIRTHADAERLVRTYHLIYLDQRAGLEHLLPPNGVSLLSQIRVVGHDGTQTEALPPLEFGYMRFEPEKRDFFPLAGRDLPARSLADPNLELVDLFGNGLLDVLEMNGAVRYWRNLGRGEFDLPRDMREAPAGLILADPDVQLIDADGDGRTDLLVTRDGLSGYFPLRFGGLWDHRSFQRYHMAPSFTLKDPEVHLVDLDGDGVTDAMRSGSRLEYFFNHPKEGWNGTRWVERQRDLEVFPNVNFSDPRVKWADMTGDGLQDIVLVYDGNVEYWPNLGYGNWGKRVSMHHSPHFPYGYDPRRILVGDVDGDGLADMVYVDDTRVILWINQSGNAWSDPITIKGTPPVSDVDAVRLADMLGSGISGVLWSTDAGALSRDHLFFLDFTGRLKPYLLNEMDNHIGAVTKVEYASSTRFYVADQKRLATRWRTSLPFPVQVVARVEVIDHFSQGKLTTEYRYHHGYWDGAEREFRGFGRVEQLDTESFEKYDSAGLHGAEAFFAKVDRQYFSPPTLTRTWFHQGPVGDEFGDWQELDWSDEYWSGDPNLLRHTETVNQFLRTWPQTPDSRRVKRDALRALRGSILRTELYALDGTEYEERPYTVTESRYGLKEIEAPAVGDTERLHIFFPHLTAQRTTQWERGDDPMTQFSFTDDYDNFGQPQLQTQAACPRGWRGLEDQPAKPYLATRTRTRYASPVDPAAYIHDRVAHTTSWEILNTAGKHVLDLTLLRDTSADLELIGHTRNFYDGNAFTGRTLGEVGRFGAVSHSESLVLTEDILQDVHGTGVPPYLALLGAIAWTADYPQEFRTLFPALAGYRFHTGGTGPMDPRGYFALTDRRRYDFHSSSGTGRGLVLETLDPLGDLATNPTGHRTVIAYDKYQLLPETVTDAAGLTTRASYDYRVMQPDEVTDPNGNVTRFTFTPLGLLASTFVRGKTPMEGDQTRPGVRMEYGFLAFDLSPPEDRQPIFVRTIRHVHHDTEADVPLPERDETITTVEYSDGFGRLLQTRTQGEELRFGDEHFGGGDGVLPGQQSAGRGGDVVGQSNTNIRNPNVVVSGWQIYDNKGRVVEKYEPFFAEGWEYGQPDDKKFGQKVTMFYDPRGHVVRTVNPDKSEQLVIYGVPGTLAAPDLEHPELFDPTPWEAYTYDANDNAGRTHGSDPTTQRYRHHWDTPTSIVIDALGRTIETVERDRDEPASPSAPLPPIKEYHTRISYDIRGNLLTVTDALNRPAFRNLYDLTNRKLHIDSIDAGIRRTVLDAAGNVVEQRDSKGALILHGYDDLNRPIRLWARDSTGERLSLRERLEYGDEGNPNQPVANRTANRNINRLGKLARHFDEAGLLAFVQCDFKGNVLEKTRQVVRDVTILSVFSAPTPGGQVAAFRVDWDNTVRTALDAQVYAISMQYDALNRLKRLTYPRDVENRRRELRPQYNRAGALEQVMLDGAPYVKHIAYNAKGQRLFIAYGNDVMTRHAYDPKTFRLVRLRTEGYSKPAASTYRPVGSMLQDFEYAYDLAGNITRIQDRTPDSGITNTSLGRDALDRKFCYDPLYRLRWATGRETDFPPDLPWNDMPRSTDITRARAYTETYLYDPVGNIEVLSHAASGGGFNRKFTLALGNNRLDTVAIGTTPPFKYRYDDNGNMTEETTSRHFEWDHSDRMRMCRTQPGGGGASLHAHYLYDAGGQRVKKLVRNQGGQVNVTVYIDGIFEHHRSIRAATVSENNSLHVMDNQSRIVLVRIGMPFANDATPAVKYHLGDHLGSTNVVVGGATAAENSFINREEYTPYGETSFGGFAKKRYRFSGKEKDEESGLSYHGARYYAPWLGRWTSCDPKGIVDGTPVYRYTRNNPVAYIDPNGQQEQEPVSGVFNHYETHAQAEKEREFLSQVSSNLVTSAPSQPIGGEAPASTVEQSAPPPSPFRFYTGPFRQASDQMMQQILDPKTDNATRMVLIYSLGMISGPTFIEDLPNTFDHFAAAGWHFGEFSEKPSFSSALKFGLNLTAGVGSLSFVMGGTLRLGGASVDTGLSARGPSGRLPSPVSPPMPGQIVPGGRPSPTAAMPIGGGHSFEIQGSFFRMSEGTVLQFPVASGELLDAEIAEAIENTGRVPTRGLYPPRQYGPGDLTPEHLLLQEGWGKATSPPGLYATTVTRPTLLSDIIKPNMGLCVFTGCRTPGRY